MSNKKFDCLIVGAGLYGSILANELTNSGLSVLVVEKLPFVGGTVRTEWKNNICVHLHGAHIFRTNSKVIWDYLNSITEFKPFINSPIAVCNGNVYNLPFNMNTFSKLWNVSTPKKAKEIIEHQIKEFGVDNPTNLEEFAISSVGKDIYELFIKGYTEKQWGKTCTVLPTSILRRIPIRFTYDNNYYNVDYQGIPKLGYTYLIEKLLKSSTVLLGVDGKDFVKHNRNIADICVYTGRIDEFYDFKFGKLDYRSLTFETDFINDIDNYQGNAVVNYSDLNIPYTRIIEHKHFLKTVCDGTIITKEYPKLLTTDTDYPYYPIEDTINVTLYKQYERLTSDIIFAGRLGNFKYYDMCDTIESAISLANNIIGRRIK